MHEWHVLLLSPVGLILWGVLAVAGLVVLSAIRPRPLPLWLVDAVVFGWIVALLVQGPT
jgi:hypothetical protein